MLLLKAFFEIYDAVEGTQHLSVVSRLYSDKKRRSGGMEKTARDFHMDMTTLWRYRKKYLKAMNYIVDAPPGSSVAEIMRIAACSGNL